MERLQGNLLHPPFPDLCMSSPAASLQASQESARHGAHTRVGGRPRRRTPQACSRGARGCVDSVAGVKIYRGVRMRSWGKWVSEIRQPKKRSRIWLGSYSTPEAAAQAYDMALYYLRGPRAAVNFPALIPSEDPPPDLSPRDVQKAAIAAGLAADNIHSRSGTDSNSRSIFNLQMNFSPSINASSIHSAQIEEDEATPLNLSTSTQFCGGGLLQQDDCQHRYPMSDQKIRYVFDFNLNETAAPESSEEGEVQDNFVQQEISLSSSLLSYAGDHGRPIRPMFLCL